MNVVEYNFCCSAAAAAAATGAAYQAGQTAGYAVAPAPAAAGYGTQRATTGYDTTYQAAATQGTYAGIVLYVYYTNLLQIDTQFFQN